MADALVTYLMGEAGWGYPMCAAAALSMVFAVWGALLEARALRFSCKDGASYDVELTKK